MTIIQPQNKYVLLNRVLACLIIGSVLVAFWLTSLYVRSVNLNHGIAEAKKALGELETSNSEIKDKIFALLDRSRLEEIAAQRGLVKEKNPRYLQAPGEPLALSR
jgi:cell division protein FtsL